MAMVPVPARSRPRDLIAGVLTLSAAAVLTACGPRGAPTPEPLSDRPALNEFVRGVERELESHRWEAVLSRAEEEHRRTQVRELGMPEPQYVAELFGLHRVGNSLDPDGPIAWSDLERIESVDIDGLTRDADRYTVTGRVTVADGSTLDLEAWVVEREEGGYALSGGVG